MRRLCRLLASEGFVAASCESYHEALEPGHVLQYNPEDTDRGNALKVSKTCDAYDNDAKALVEYLANRPDCNGRVGSIGMCLVSLFNVTASMQYIYNILLFLIYHNFRVGT